MTVSALSIFNEAKRAGMVALNACVPNPMIVTGQFPSGQKSTYFVSEGACGFAWVKIPGNSWFIRELKKLKIAGGHNDWDAEISKSYGGGYQYWVHEGGQSISRKEAFAKAFSQVLTDHGIKNTWGSRLD